MRRAVQAHYVRHNAVTRIPRNFIYLDSETYSDGNERQQVQTFRCAVTCYDRRSHSGDGWRQPEWAEHGDTASLWSWIMARTQAQSRTVLVAHNLAYDLRICAAFDTLPAAGWELQFVRLDNKGACCTWKHGRKTLVMIDSLSWLPLPLEAIGELCEIPKLPLPAWEDSDGAWFARCRRDVEILADAYRRVIDYVRTHDLGNWKPTGAGQAWAAFRHRFMHHHLFVHGDDDARSAERAAAHTGRCEAWRHGEITGGPFYEWDYQTAYAQIGATCDVPVKLHGELIAPTLDGLHKAARRTRVLADVVVTTDRPTVPHRGDAGICWPVGTFRTTLWDNELSLALAEGAHVVPVRAWWYRKAPALAEFCGWVLGGLRSCTGELDPVVRVMLKHWSRALVGRTAAQWSRWEQYGRSPVSGLALGKCNDTGAGECFDLMHVGHQLIRLSERTENPDAMVAIMSWIMAECRVRLWQTMQRAGLDHVLYVDTDSLWVDQAGHDRLLRARVPGLRVKQRAGSLRILGPRQIIPNGRLVAAGVPRGAVPVDGDTWEGDVWQGIAQGLRWGDSDRVLIERRRFKMSGIDRRRQHLPGGMTSPVVVGELPATEGRAAS